MGQLVVCWMPNRLELIHLVFHVNICIVCVWGVSGLGELSGVLLFCVVYVERW